MATSIFSIIDGLTVGQEDIIEAELFAEQYLSAQFPTYDFRQGTALRDMTVRPNATLLALVNKAIKFYFDDTDIINITNATDSDIVDNRLSNFFITRKTGDSSVVKARLYFSFPTTTPISTIIPSTASFSVDNSTMFYPKGSISVNPDPGVLLRADDRFYFLYDSASELHYVDVDLKAQVADSGADLTEGDLLYFSIFSPYFVSGSILYLMSSAIEAETNEEMVNRSYSSISTRNLINTPSIEASITDQFNYAGEVYPAGLGNKDLYRDIIAITRVEPDAIPGTIQYYHRGGHVDIYVDTATVTQKLQFTIGDNSSFEIAGPVLSITRSAIAEPGKSDDTVPMGEDFRYATNSSRYDDLGVPVTPEFDIGLSTQQITTVTVPAASSGETITFDVLVYSGLNAISSAINSKEQRVVAADYLVRAFEPVYIDIDVELRSTVDTTVAVSALTKYIDSIQSGGSVYMSSIVSLIQESGLSNFKMPIAVTATSNNRYREYDSSDVLVSDTITEVVLDSYTLRSNQMFKVRTITLEEVVTP